ncbi:Methyltransferase domain-containing protein [Stigmatella aurantiaca]|uniref:Methyltransferase domain-containing protein n=1 Tax=Stigmatella aurantiaca TaxID=41 RepID=A0A1H7VNA3_STIAU|nr:class I SAM-dependent methyltransferase [Stigmatella aurantiaca]SEM10369.1 Methyltransferase domain-containing protein [Stigmatella aurantiaca]
MDIQPGDRVLEIGCGAGIAAGLVAEKLQTGSLTAIDRSAPMVQKASARNRSSIEDGRAVFLAVPIEKMQSGAKPYDKAFAFNVSLFWGEPSRALRTLSALLKPDGRLYVFHQPPSEAKTRPIAEATRRLLEAQGYAVQETRYQPMKPATVSCVLARPAR